MFDVHAAWRWLKLAALGALALPVASCMSQVVKNPSPIPPPQAVSQAYVIEPGDDLDIRFFYNPELNEEVTVRPDGDISLPLAGQVRAAGLTPTQLEDSLKGKYSQELRQAAITVMVKGIAGQRVYVDGEVGQPQMVSIPGNLTAMQAIASAGGFKQSARKSEVLVIRRNGTQRPIVIPIDLEKTIRGVDTTQDIQLQPYDIVFVPQSKIGEVNDFIDQYFRKNVPIPFGVGYSFF
ncbi:MAG: polysaccharide biosynthesis/export family protein [Magnetospirillum sp.]|nr:polysaccharide biosynthesis/export family protein [Magnetospirillum sp.]